MECLRPAGADVRPLLLRRRAGRPQLKRDPLGARALMTAPSVPTSPFVHRASLRARVLQGILIGALLTVVAVTSIFVTWPKVTLGLTLWALGTFVPFALGGAAGGATYYSTDHWRIRGGLQTVGANVLSLIAFCLVSFIAAGLFFVVAVFPFGDQ